MRWVGGGVTNNWSSDSGGLTNWFDVTTMNATDALPMNGDDLLFDNTATGFRTNNNDFASLQLGSITITGDNYVITGNPLTLTGPMGITSNPSTAPPPDIETDLILAGNQVFTCNGRAALFLTGNIDLNGNALTIAGDSNVFVSSALGKGVISSTGGGGSLDKSGGGALFLEGANTFAGGVVIHTGGVEIRNNTALGAGPATVQSGAELSLGGFFGNLTVPENLSVAGAGPSGQGAIVDGFGTNTLTGSVNLTADTTVTTMGDKLTFQGVISGGAGVTLSSAFGLGSFIFSGANTYQGATVINSGILQAGATNVIPATSNVTLSQSGATLDLHGFDQTIGSLSGVAGSTVTLGSATLKVGMTNLQTTFAGTITGTGGLTKVGTGTETLGGSVANTFTGQTTVMAGTLVLAKTGNAPAVSGNVVIGTEGSSTAVLQTVNAGQVSYPTQVTINSPGLFDLVSGSQSVGDLNGSGNITLDSSSSQLVVSVAGNLSGGITEPNGPSGGVVKDGVSGGTLTLSGANSYQGPTVVEAGTLNVTGTLARSPIRLSPSNLGLGARLAGTGTVGDVTATGGTLVPGNGNGPGILTAHNVTLGPSTKFDVVLNGTTAGSGFSQLVITGTINLGSSTLTATLGFTPPAGTSLALIKNTGSGAVQGTFSNLPEGQHFSIGGKPFQITYLGGAGNDVVVTATQSVNNIKVFAIGGAPGLVQVRRDSDGSLVVEFAPYGSSYTGPISVAVGDVTGDGFLDIITGAMVGNPDVRVYDGRAIANGTFDPNNPNASLLAQWFPYALQLNLGANVAVGDIEHNGFADIVTGATVGNPDVRVYRGNDIANRTFNPTGASLIAQWFPYGLDFNIGANVAVGDVNGDGFADVVTGATAGNPDVRVYNGHDIATGNFNPTGASLLAQLFPYALQLNVGAFVAVGDTTGDGFGDVITGATVGNPDVRVYRGRDIADGMFQNNNPDASLLTQFFAYDLNFNIGATVTSADIENDGHFDILTGASSGSPHFRVVKGNATGTIPPALFEGIASDLQGGISVGA
jgi:autotransporter-associated beta strand protein